MIIKAETLYVTNRCDTSRQQVAPSLRPVASPCLHCCCNKAACAYFAAAICRTNSNQFKFMRQIAATKFCCSDNDVHMSHKPICCSNLSWRRVAAICRIVCLSLKLLTLLQRSICHKTLGEPSLVPKASPYTL